MKRWCQAGWLAGIVLSLSAVVAVAQVDPLGDKGKQFDDLLTMIAKYEFGQSRESQTQLTDLMRGLKGDAVKAIEKKFLAFLKSGATAPGKQFICRQLSLIGSEESAETLAGMLSDPQTADMARFALERIPGAAVDEALRKSLEKSAGAAKVGIISTLGLRADKASVPVLQKLVYDSSADVASAAVTALGQIADPAATAALSEAKTKTTGELQMLVLDSYLSCGDRLEQAGKAAEAAKIYREIYEAKVPGVIRVAAFRGMVFCSKDQAGKIIVDVIQKGDPELKSVAFVLVNEIQKPEEIALVAAEVPKLPPASQVQLITALANRGHEAARAAVTECVKSPNEEVRVAAFKALAKLGNADCVLPLATAAASARGVERDAARETLYALRDPQADKTILDAIAKAEPAAKVELIRSIGERNIRSADAVLLAAAADADRKVRLEAFKVMQSAADESQLPAMLDLLVKVQTDTERVEAEKAVAAVCRRGGDATQYVDTLIAKMASAPTAGKSSLLTLLGQIGGEKAYSTLSTAIGDTDETIRDAAIRALAEFPDSRPTEALLVLSQNATKPANKIIGLRGYVRMIGLTQAATEDRVVMCEKAMALATRVEEKRLVLSAASRIPDEKAVAFVSKAAGDAQLAAEAKAAQTELDRLLKSVTIVTDSATLAAKTAKITGMGAMYDPAKDCIANWQDEKTVAAWDVVFKQSGSFEVEVLQSMAGSPDSEYKIILGKQELIGQVRETGDWAKFETVKVGVLSVDRPGVYSIVFQPTKKTGEFVVNLKGISLKQSRQVAKVILGAADFSAWRPPLGDWQIVADAVLKADNPAVLEGKPGAGAILNGPTGRTVYLYSKAEFGDCAAHIEFMVPKGSNSGVYFQGRYEIQILDSWGVKEPTYTDCGGIYERWKDDKGYEGHAPKVNASKEPGQWQSFDMIFRAPRFDAAGKKIANAKFEKVVHNGQIVHENVEVTGPTRAAVYEDEKPLGALVLQGDHGPVAYRNMWIEPLK
jgi:HEAT repeat protein